MNNVIGHIHIQMMEEATLNTTYPPHTGTYRIPVPTAYQYLPHTSTYRIPDTTAYNSKYRIPAATNPLATEINGDAIAHL